MQTLRNEPWGTSAQTVGDFLIVLFGGGTKKTQPKDIETAKLLHTEYKARKKAISKPSVPSTKKTR